MGMEPERLYNAVKRFKQLGERGERTWRVPAYQLLKRHAAMVVNPAHPYHLLANSMVWLSDRYPKPLLKPVPSWFKELTYGRRHDHGRRPRPRDADHRSRLHRTGSGDPIGRRRSRRHRDPGTRRPGRRNLARHNLSRRELRRPLAAVLVLVRQEPDLVAYATPLPRRSTAISKTWPTRFDIRRHIRFGHEVSDLAFDEDDGVWTATTKRRKRFRARTVVLASGPLSDVSFPDIRGLDSYRGHKIHSARWDHDYDFAGKRVAVIGTGASAIQIIPELVKQAGFVKVFQRTPCWVLPRLDVATPPAVQTLFAKVPATQQLARQALFWGHEASATALVWDTPVDVAGRASGAGTPARSGQGSVAAAPADAGLPRRGASACWSPATTTPPCSATTASSSTGRSPR